MNRQTLFLCAQFQVENIALIAHGWRVLILFFYLALTMATTTIIYLDCVDEREGEIVFAYTTAIVITTLEIISLATGVLNNPSQLQDSHGYKHSKHNDKLWKKLFFIITLNDLEQHVIFTNR